MSAALTLALPEHLDRLDALVATCHEEADIPLSPERRRAALAPLLEGTPHGAAYLIGPARAPIGYVIVSFGWSVQYGGLDGRIDEIYVRPGVRKRGVASEALLSLPRALADAGLKALHLEVDDTNMPAQKLYARVGFAVKDGQLRMTRKF